MCLQLDAGFVAVDDIVNPTSASTVCVTDQQTLRTAAESPSKQPPAAKYGVHPSNRLLRNMVDIQMRGGDHDQCLKFRPHMVLFRPMAEISVTIMPSVAG